MYLIDKSKEIRRSILNMIFEAKSGHIGGSFSCVDILVTLFFGKNIKFNPKVPLMKNRDRLIVSKGHASAAFYSTLSHLGFFPKKELKKYCKNNTVLATHLSSKVPGVEFDTGSLGHCLGVGCGIAYSAKLDNKKYKIFVLISDGELYEGSTWEAIMFANNFKLNNMILIIDRNRQIVMDKTEDCIKLEPLEEKLKSFGCKTYTVDGHSHKILDKTFKKIRKSKNIGPVAILANTIKGKGISFMEGQTKWHHAIPSDFEYKKGIQELI